MYRRFLSLLLLCFAAPLHAQTLSLGVDDLTQVLNTPSAPEDAAQAILIQRLLQALDATGLSLQAGQVLLRASLANIPLVEPRCAYRAALERMDVSIALRSGSQVGIDLQNLREPVVATVRATADLRGSNGRVEQVTGIPWINNRCIGEARYGFDIAVTGTVDVDLRVLVTPEGTVLPGGIIRYTPRLQVTGSITPQAYRVDVEDTLWEPVLEAALTRRLDEYFSSAAQAQLVAEVERELYRQMELSWGARYVDVAVPDLTPGQIEPLYRILAAELAFPLTSKYLEDNKLALLTALFTRDTPALRRLLAGAAACDASRLLLADLPHRPLYARANDGRCVVADLRTAPPVSTFADATCATPAAFRATAQLDYCAETSDPARLGNAVGLSEDPAPWTLWPGNQFDIGLVPIAGLNQPYMTRTRYRSVVGPRGTCELEMRIYKPAVAATGLKPLLALHGGSWQNRSNGLLGLEALVAQYTERGFVVFAPFYRLTGDTEGAPSCNGVTGREIVADVEAALTWVRDNGARFGARPGKVFVTGQSAGGHLAEWLAVQQPEHIERALLFYPPTDFGDFLVAVRSGAPVDARGVAVVERFLGLRLASVGAGDPWAAANSFPPRVAAQPKAFPPVFAIHGVADKVVPVGQSVRLCNAFSGNPEAGVATANGGDPASGEYRRLYRCDDRGSELHLIAQGDHALDTCLFGAVCPAGGEASQAAARGSVRAGYDWLAATGVGEVPASAGSGTALAQASERSAMVGGGGGLGWVWLGLLAGAAVVRGYIARKA